MAGYKDPPKKSQFKKGQSGNPKGRPKGSKRGDIIAALRKALDETERIQIAGKRQTLSRGEVIALRAIEKAMKGDHRYFKTIVEQLHGYPTAKHEIEGSMSIIDELYDKARKHKGEKYGGSKSAKK